MTVNNQKGNYIFKIQPFQWRLKHEFKIHKYLKNKLWKIIHIYDLKPKLFSFWVSYIKGGIQAKSIWKQDPEANIWAQEGWEWGVEKAPQWGTS